MVAIDDQHVANGRLTAPKLYLDYLAPNRYYFPHLSISKGLSLQKY